MMTPGEAQRITRMNGFAAGPLYLAEEALARSCSQRTVFGMCCEYAGGGW